MSDEEQKPRTQSKEVRALMKNAARTNRSQRARDLLCKLIRDQTGLEVDPSKITSTKYNREIGVKFVPQDEPTFPWPVISTSQISSHDLARLETAVTHDKVIASKDDIYNAAASFRSRNGSRASISLPPTPQQPQYLQSHHAHSHPHDFQQPHTSPQQQHQLSPFRSPGGPFLGAGAGINQQPQSHHPGQNSRLNSLAEASSSSQPWINAAATSTSITQFSPSHPAQTTPETSTTSNANIEPSIMLNDSTTATTMASAAAASFSPLHSVTPTNSRKRSRSPDLHQDTSHLTSSDMEIDHSGFIKIKIPRLSIKDIMDEESKGQLKRIHELEAQLAEIQEMYQRQNQEIQALRAENERLLFGGGVGGATTIESGENEEVMELRAENERLKALGRKLFE